MTHPDQPRIIYQGPPRWNGSQWTNGDRFTLSGEGKTDLGVELAGSVTGLDRPTEEYRYDAGANTPGSKLVNTVAGRREILAGINILGDSPRDFRAKKRAWERNHSTKEPGRLWVITPEDQPRYLSVYKAETAGTASLDKDPHIRQLLEDWDWGWTSDDAYWRGYEERRDMAQSGSDYTARFFNSSTAPVVYPKILFRGPGTWRIPGTHGQRVTVLPTLSSNEEIQLDYNPAFKTLLLRNTTTGSVTNIWHEFKGVRPHLHFEPETDVEVTMRKFDTSVSPPPQLSYTPMFTSWI